MHTHYVYQTPRSRALLENSLPLMELECSLPCSQEFATGHYPGQNEIHSTLFDQNCKNFSCPICGTCPPPNRVRWGFFGHGVISIKLTNSFTAQPICATGQTCWLDKQSVTFCCAHALYAYFFLIFKFVFQKYLYYLRYVISAS
jgi:hypothetical protein